MCRFCGGLTSVHRIGCPSQQQVDRTIIDECCPKCGGELDTGFECNKCGFDAMPLVQEFGIVAVMGKK